jgi:hypothetical protein
MGFEDIFCFPGGGMFIGKGVDGPVQYDAFTYVFGIEIELFPFYKIANKDYLPVQPVD